MNNITIKQRQNPWKENDYFFAYAIDDILFHDWLYQFKKETEEEFAVNTLMPTFDLWRKDELEIVWHHLGQIKSEGTHYVPLLTCPDDLDLTCNVVMTEQVFENDKIYWKRFGWNMGSVSEQDPAQIAWFSDNIPELSFTKEAFIKVFSFLNQVVINDWQRHYSEKITIPFPAKEDWELEVDSWYD